MSFRAEMGAEKLLSFILIALLVLPGCASKRAGQGSINGVSQEAVSSATWEELEVGRQIHALILSSFYPYTDPKVVSYVNQIGQSLAEQAERQDLTYRFTVLYNDKIYATAAPGGYVYLTTALIHFLENEAELAAVLAHEIGQLQYRDARFSETKRALKNLTEGVAMVGPAFGHIGALAVIGLAVLNAATEGVPPTLEARMAKADERALDYMVRAGYDPQGLIDFLYRLTEVEEDSPVYLKDYRKARPVTPERFRQLQEKFMELPLEDKTFSAHRKTFQQITKGISQIYATS